MMRVYKNTAWYFESWDDIRLDMAMEPLLSLPSLERERGSALPIYYLLHKNYLSIQYYVGNALPLPHSVFLNNFSILMYKLLANLVQ
jgi:hypothetical protein